MASTSMKIKSTGFCFVDIYIHKSKYDAIRLNLFDDLCSDVILELDFQCQHQRLIFQFDGECPDLIVANDKVCSVGAATAEKVSLFSNLSRGIDQSPQNLEGTIKRIESLFRIMLTSYLKRV